MSRNEIRLRRHRMTASGADRFRNYNDVLIRHERDMRIKKIMRAFLMFMVILILVGLIFFLWRIEQGDVPFEKKEPEKTSMRPEAAVMTASGRERPFETGLLSCRFIRSAVYAPDSPSTL